MADNKITRDVYKAYASKIASVLDKEDFYEQFKKRVDKGSSSFKLAKKRLIQDISIDWIDTIESILPNLDTIVRNPRKFIVQEEDIVDVSLARSISTESVKYLAQHTNMISKVDEKTGDVTPSKILNITKEESFEIYENRFIYTLLLKLKDFVTMRYDKIKKASATQDVLELDIESRFNLPSKKITYRTEYFAQLSFDEVMRLDPDTLTKIERVAKIDRIITDFLSSSFAKSMRNSAPVRPPIMRTNVILKEPNFKKALTLWQFIETYQQTGGFSTSDEVEDYPIEDASIEKLRNMVTLNTMVFESLYDECESDMDMEDKEFADFLRVGQMDFEKDKIDRDEFAQKLDDQIENEEEQNNVEEVKAQEEEEAEKEIPPEKLPEPDKPQEIEKEIEKPHEIEKEIVVERPVEVERLKEMPPKADQEEVDLEPDAEKFDQHLFEVRKVFKRPDDDKLKQEEIIKARDAIDRCLTSYRRIKQEELEERDRQERIRRRRDDIKKRAEAFKKQREELEKNIGGIETNTLGMDPFSYQKAKIAEQKRKEELIAQENERKAELEKLKKRKIERVDDEHLELEDKNTEGIVRSIDETEKARAKTASKNAKIDMSLDAIDAVMPLEGDVPLVPRGVYKNTPIVERVPEEEEKLKQSEEKSPKKPGRIRKAKQENITPWSDEPKKQAELKPVDENKVKVGEVHVKSDDAITPWGEDANLGKLDDKQETDKRKRRAKTTEQGVENVIDATDSEENASKANRKKMPKDPWSLSATTLNQKYSTPSGKNKHIEAVDENKVKVGGIRFKKDSGIVDPFGEIYDVSSAVEKHDDDESK